MRSSRPCQIGTLRQIRGGSTSGTGKAHLLIALGTAAAKQGRRARHVTTAALVKDLVEAADDGQLSRVVGRSARLDLLCLDEFG
ncbi:ATP-binding protein [Dietzia sp. SYD-A1]|uniref:ATP-binding protein n=1 Tax=Dietzia sp. SYD-A1 TaxID=2780141 RepID=UPI001E42D31F|nr:ATP-binding protein [Dietzia sp. SYD-A1]